MLIDKISMKTTNFYTVIATTISKRLQGGEVDELK